MKKYFLNQKGIAPIVIILIVIGILGMVGGGLWYWQKQKEKTPLISVKILDEETRLPITKEVLVKITYYTGIPCLAVVNGGCLGPYEIEKKTNNKGVVIFDNIEIKRNILRKIERLSDYHYQGKKVFVSINSNDYIGYSKEIFLNDLANNEYKPITLTLTVIDISKALQNINYCDKFPEKRDKCIFMVVSKTNDVEDKIDFCNKLTTLDSKSNCISSIFAKVEISNFTIKTCYKLKELKIYDDSISSGFNKCVKDYVLRHKEEQDKCSLIENLLFRQFCFEIKIFAR